MECLRQVGGLGWRERETAGREPLFFYMNEWMLNATVTHGIIICALCPLHARQNHGTQQQQRRYPRRWQKTKKKCRYQHRGETGWYPLYPGRRFEWKTRWWWRRRGQGQGQVRQRQAKQEREPRPRPVEIALTLSQLVAVFEVCVCFLLLVFGLWYLPRFKKYIYIYLQSLVTSKFNTFLEVFVVVVAPSKKSKGGEKNVSKRSRFLGIWIVYGVVFCFVLYSQFKTKRPPMKIVNFF